MMPATPTETDFRAALTHVLSLLRDRYEFEAPGYYELFTEELQPCSTCALRTGLHINRGLEKTVLGLIAALALEDKDFYCHHGAEYVKGLGWKVNPLTTPICYGFMVLGGISTADLAYALTAGMRLIWPDYPTIDDAGLIAFAHAAEHILLVDQTKLQEHHSEHE